LKNQVALVTGAASGIGKEIARKFVAEGASVVIADLNGKAAEATAAELGGAGRALGVGMDVADEAQAEARVARAAEAFGRLDILVSNAGIQTVAPVHEFEFAKWKQLLAVHLDGAFLTTRAALRHMPRWSPRKGRRTGSAPTWSAPASSARRWSTSRSRSRHGSSVLRKTRW
jgi:3-hydroxybutyrate dehydrogenase